jgi:hypothetical protein
VPRADRGRDSTAHPTDHNNKSTAIAIRACRWSQRSGHAV